MAQSPSQSRLEVERCEERGARGLDLARWTVGVGLVVIAAALVALAADVLFIIFGGLLVGLLLDRLTWWIQTLSHLPRPMALVLVLCALFAGCVGIGLAMAPSISQQAVELQQQLPVIWERLAGWLRDHGMPIDALVPTTDLESLVADGGGAFISLSGVFAGIGGALAGFFIAVVLGTYYALDPGIYRRGLQRILPHSHRRFGADLFQRWHHGLGHWIVAKLLSMLVIAVLTGIGLWLLGVPLVLVNALIVGLLAFVPNFGPIIAAAPPLLLALSVSPTLAFWVLIFYVAVQMVEGYAITPNIMRLATRMPQALVLVAQLLAGALFGLAGLVLAVPAGLTVMIFVQTWIDHRDARLGSDALEPLATEREPTRAAADRGLRRPHHWSPQGLL